MAGSGDPFGRTRLNVGLGRAGCSGLAFARTVSEKHRPIRSFVLRGGRMTAAQQRALDDNWGRWGLEAAAGQLAPEQAFGRSAPLVLEIGFGMGLSLLEQAASQPQTNYVGIEVHPPGVGKLMQEMVAAGVDNIRVYRDDAVVILRECIADQSLDGVQIFFPDPWHKKRHHKRRLIQPDFIAMLRDKLVPGGFLHVATDWENYAEYALEVLSADPVLENTAADGTYIERPRERPLTKFEARGERLGHGVWDLMFRVPD
ncbi:tRNA (guanosine(46)-N7)-methyltransferase TrmB [Halieaceae bacterium IMCC14734]|uniref:tRNA (guanine-N(7)-)-methyltransferase n=2 Tax=Candidatus Litorirhabdus singularis TaxID=2518993 RepID=A0ABT3TCK4_9GAMM|nr:tRNA (guanosine(46)-N7)-methyltransferase TrmB [Candidatus Litorirhabdus singularis]